MPICFDADKLKINMDLGILSTNFGDTESTKRLPDKTDCRICWNPIIGEGFRLRSVASSHDSVSFSEMYLYVSGIEPDDDPESLCWGCAKDLTFAYKIMKKVEEKEKCGNFFAKLQTNRKTIKTEIKQPPPLMEMVVIKVEPEDYYEMDSEHGNFDEGSSSSSDDSYEEPAPKARKSAVPQVHQGQKKFVYKPNVIQCALCYYNTRNKENYQKHVVDHHGQQKLKCDGCAEEFLFIYELEAHRNDMHQLTDKYVAQVAPEWVLPPIKSDEPKVVVKQEVCDTTVESSPQVPEQKQYKLDILGRRIPLNRVYKKKDVKYPKKERMLPINCPLCPYTGLGKSNFRNHYRVKHNKQELQCDGCDAKFHLFYRLYRHREEEHNFSHEYVVDESLKVTYEPIKKDVKKPYIRKPKHGQYYQCPKCDEILRGPRILKDHLKDVHNYVKERTSVKVICDFCGKFVVDQNLEYHIRHIHPEHRDPFICHYCGDKLKSKTSLLRHMQSTHKLALNQRGSPCALMCRFCTEVFRTKHLRVSHEVRIHTFDYRFNCTLCEKRFFIKRHLEAHMRAHAKGKMKKSKLKCHVCGECFSRKQILAEHIATHYTNDVSVISDNLAKNLAHLVALKYEQHDN